MNPTFPFIASTPAGLSFQLNRNGSPRRMECGDIHLNLFPGTETEGGPANIHLRLLGPTTTSIPLLGPSSPASWSFHENGMTGHGSWNHIAFRIRLILSQSSPAWFWHLELENTGTSTLLCDLIHTQDIGIAHYGAIRLNEFYVSQYIDHSPLTHPTLGVTIASRQNQSMGGRHPWTLIGSLRNGISYATDALQFHGLATRNGMPPAALLQGLPGTRLQHEHSLVCIQDEAFHLPPGLRETRGFFTWFEADHPTATSHSDLEIITTALALPEAVCPPWPDPSSCHPNAPSIFSSAPFLAAQDVSLEEARTHFGKQTSHEETTTKSWLSFFTPENEHVVAKSKELEVLRPHGHILRSGSALIPDEAALTSTSWMGGVFHSMVTQGHVSINRFLSTTHSYLSLFRSHGQRIFAEIDGTWMQLGIPSAFAMTADACRWIYQHKKGTIEVVSSASESTHSIHLVLRVLAGPPLRFLISHHISMNGDDGLNPGTALWKKSGAAILIHATPDSDVGRRFPNGSFAIEPDPHTIITSTGGDELLYPDGRSRNEPFVCLLTAPSLHAGLSIRGNLVPAEISASPDFWKSIANTLTITTAGSGPTSSAAHRVASILPWFIHNSLVHYLSPRGLEQYSGGGWGTRDICQGPLELLLALGRFAPIRDLLLRVFRQQNHDGDWPQWFMFFDRERNIRPGDSHGDIVYWPLLALAQYLDATGEKSLLDEHVPFFQHDGNGETTTILAHVDRALELIRNRVIPNTKLAAYGHGDWNDSLQPAKPEMRKLLCSAWTVTLNYQTFLTLADAFRKTGYTERAGQLESDAAAILDGFQKNLIINDAIAGLVYFHPNADPEPLLHPNDTTTGLSYSLLPMIHAIINDMLTPDLAAHHLQLIRTHLTGPDGAHLFDRPMKYQGGISTNFQRAETASYFGREIGIMYTHAHIRYAEALARLGNATEFFHALCQINPIALRELVPCTTTRQVNCYFSSSDPAFSDRYQAFTEYDKVNRGAVPLEGGWRVYSSGPGLAVRLIIHCFLGLRVQSDGIVIDPCITPQLDGLNAHVHLNGLDINVTYHTGSSGFGPVSAQLNGTTLPHSRLTNRYRTAGIRIPIETWNRHLKESENQLLVTLE